MFTTKAVLTRAILTTRLQALPQLLLRVHRLGGVGVCEGHHARQLAEDERHALLLGGEEGLGAHHDGQQRAEETDLLVDGALHLSGGGGMASKGMARMAPHLRAVGSRATGEPWEHARGQ